MKDELITEIKYNLEKTPIESLESLTKQINNELGKTEQKLKGIDNNQKKTFKKAKKNVEDTKKTTDQLGNSLGITEDILKELGGQVNSTAIGINKLTVNVKNYNKVAKDTKEETKSLTNELKNMASSYIGFQSLKSGIALYSGFSDQMVRVKALTRANTEEYSKLIQSAKKLGATTSFTASQVGEAYVELAQKGKSINDIMGLTPGILALAEASSLDLAQTTSILTGTMNAFQAGTEETMYYTDLIAKAQAAASVTTASLGESFGESAASAYRYKHNIKDLTSLLMTLGDYQLSGSSAGTGINAIYENLSKKSGKLKKLFNVNAYDKQTGKMRKLEDIILDITKATANMSEEQKNAKLGDIFDVTAMKTVGILMAGGAEKVKEYKKQLENVDGTAKEFSKVMNEELGGSMRSLSSAFEGVGISVMTTVAPALQGLTEVLTAVLSGVNWFFDLVNKNDWSQSLVAGLTGATFAVKTLGWAFKLLNISNPFGWIAIGISAITILEKKFKVFSKAANWFKDKLGFGSDDKKEKTKPVTEQIPKHARGTSFAPGGITLVGEEGPELVEMPRGSKVYNAMQTKNIFSQPQIENSSFIGIILQLNTLKNAIGTVGKELAKLFFIEKKINEMNLSQKIVVEKIYKTKEIQSPDTYSEDIPKYARGTTFAKGGITLVGEEGPELIKLPRGTQVFNNEKTNSILNNYYDNDNSKITNIDNNYKTNTTNNNFSNLIKNIYERTFENIKNYSSSILNTENISNNNLIKNIYERTLQKNIQNNFSDVKNNSNTENDYSKIINTLNNSYNNQKSMISEYSKINNVSNLIKKENTLYDNRKNIENKNSTNLLKTMYDYANYVTKNAVNNAYNNLYDSKKFDTDYDYSSYDNRVYETKENNNYVSNSVEDKKYYVSNKTDNNTMNTNSSSKGDINYISIQGDSIQITFENVNTFEDMKEKIEEFMFKSAIKKQQRLEAILGGKK